jgi:hypothetical protein
MGQLLLASQKQAGICFFGIGDTTTGSFAGPCSQARWMFRRGSRWCLAPRVCAAAPAMTSSLYLRLKSKNHRKWQHLANRRTA